MIRELIALDPSSKVWIYQADRTISYDELDEMRPLLHDFLQEWTSHNQALSCYGNIFHQRFLAIFVDETAASSASGCSIDKSVKFVEYLGKHFQIDFFDRLHYTYLHDEEVRTIPHIKMKAAYIEGQITDETLFFDHLVSNKEAFLKRWLVPLSSSWHARFVK